METFCAYTCAYLANSQTNSAAGKPPLVWFPSSLELENDFATAFPLRGMGYGRFRFDQRISSLDFCFKQAALCHFEQRPKGFHTFLLCRVIVPFIDPDAPEPEVFENEQTIWNF